MGDKAPPPVIRVTLTPYEAIIAAHVGCMRHQAALRNALKDAYGYDGEDGWTKHIEGAGGEMGTGKVLNRYWCPSVNTFSAADLDLEIQVRTRSDHKWDLCIRKKDNPAHAYVLVTGKMPNFVVRGYRLADASVRRDDWWGDKGGRGHPAWWVPQNELWPITDLIQNPMKIDGRSGASAI